MMMKIAALLAALSLSAGASGLWRDVAAAAADAPQAASTMLVDAVARRQAVDEGAEIDPRGRGETGIAAPALARN